MNFRFLPIEWWYIALLWDSTSQMSWYTYMFWLQTFFLKNKLTNYPNVYFHTRSEFYWFYLNSRIYSLKCFVSSLTWDHKFYERKCLFTCNARWVGELYWRKLNWSGADFMDVDEAELDGTSGCQLVHLSE